MRLLSIEKLYRVMLLSNVPSEVLQYETGKERKGKERKGKERKGKERPFIY